MADRRPERLVRLRTAIDAARLDGLFITCLPNIRYLTGFSGTSALLLVTQREVALVTDFRYQTQASAESGDVAQVTIESQSLWAGLWRLLPTLGVVEVIGFESGHLTHRDFQRLLDSGAKWQWRPTTEVVERLRESKDEGEVACIAEAAEIAERALARALPEVHAGMSELQVAGLLERALREEGSEGFPFPSIVASGVRSALPHARSSAKELRRGELLLLDFGAERGGYCADITRTVTIGKADERQRDIHSIVREANESASRRVRAGMRGRDADALARSLITQHGHGEAFGHSLGHGLGLEVHESPRLARTVEAPLPTDAVVTIEPGVYEPGWGGIRIEDDVHLAESGPILLTHFTRDLLEVA